MQIDVLTIGSAMVDMISILSQDKLEPTTYYDNQNTYLMLALGSKIETSKNSIYIGGGALNSAFAYNKLCMPSSPIVKVGNDMGYSRIKNHLEQNSINSQYCLIDEKLSTGSAIILNCLSAGDSVVLTQRGANNNLTLQDIKKIEWRNIKLLHIAPLSQESATSLPHCIDYASFQGAFITVNLGKIQIEKYIQQYLQVAHKTQLLSINYQEALVSIKNLLKNNAIDLKKKQDTTIAIKNQEFECDFSQLAFAMHTKYGLPYLLMTNGSKGAWLSHNNEIYFATPISTNVISTIGAGDAFCATLSWGLYNGLNKQHALKLASINSASVVRYEDTTSGLMSYDELDTQM